MLMIKTFGKVLAVILLLATAIAFYYRSTLFDIYRTVNMFKQENLVESFRSMYKLQPSKRVAKAEHRGDEVFEFAEEPASLPESFPYKGKTLVLRDFLESTVTTGLLVVVDDKIKFEQYYLGANKDTLFASHSMGKSFVSALMGIAIANGDVNSVDDPVTLYIPELKDTAFEGVTIKHALNMATGVRFNEDYGDLRSDINRMSLSMLTGKPIESFMATLEREHEPGTYNQYVSINTEIIGLIVRNATGKGLAEYLEENIWQKIGVENDAWWVLDHGRELAMGGLSVSVRDYARFARLYLHNGNWNGQQLIPQQWVRDSLATDEPHLKAGDNPLSDTQSLGYGYQWWIPDGNEGEFVGLGIYSQLIYVNSRRGVIIVKTSANPNFQKNDFEDDMIAIEAFREISRQLAPKQ